MILLSVFYSSINFSGSENWMMQKKTEVEKITPIEITD